MQGESRSSLHDPLRQGGVRKAIRWGIRLLLGGMLLAPSPGHAQETQDTYEPDNYKEIANRIKIGLEHKQTHNFYTAPGEAPDEDWVKFVGGVNLSYVIETLDVAPGNNTWLQLYAPDGIQCIGYDENPLTPDASIPFTVDPGLGLDTGTYYVRALFTSCIIDQDPCGLALNPDCVVPANSGYDIQIRPTWGGLGNVGGIAYYQGSAMSGLLLRIRDSVNATYDVTTGEGGAFQAALVTEGSLTVESLTQGYEVVSCEDCVCSGIASDITVYLAKRTCSWIGTLDRLGWLGLGLNCMIPFIPLFAAGLLRIARTGCRRSRSRPAP